mmetsp:Transcript_19536/g.59108  ORF Transcript_19536/g.59108 Transcript_19536/m.59108 type:complete len:204 (+) Transcript_19536:3563-4174(+)
MPMPRLACIRSWRNSSRRQTLDASKTLPSAAIPRRCTCPPRSCSLLSRISRASPLASCGWASSRRPLMRHARLTRLVRGRKSTHPASRRPSSAWHRFAHYTSLSTRMRWTSSSPSTRRAATSRRLSPSSRPALASSAPTWGCSPSSACSTRSTRRTSLWNTLSSSGRASTCARCSGLARTTRSGRRSSSYTSTTTSSTTQRSR